MPPRTTGSSATGRRGRPRRERDVRPWVMDRVGDRHSLRRLDGAGVGRRALRGGQAASGAGDPLREAGSLSGQRRAGLGRRVDRVVRARKRDGCDARGTRRHVRATCAAPAHPRPLRGAVAARLVESGLPEGPPVLQMSFVATRAVGARLAARVWPARQACSTPASTALASSCVGCVSRARRTSVSRPTARLATARSFGYVRRRVVPEGRLPARRSSARAARSGCGIRATGVSCSSTTRAWVQVPTATEFRGAEPERLLRRTTPHAGSPQCCLDVPFEAATPFSGTPSPPTTRAPRVREAGVRAGGSRSGARARGRLAR